MCHIQKPLKPTAVTAVFGDSTAVSLQFLNKHHKSNYYAKYQCCNSLFGLVPTLVEKSGKSAPFTFIKRV